MRELVASKNITFLYLPDHNDKEFFKLVCQKFDFGNIISVDFDSDVASRIFVTTDQHEYIIRLWNITENDSNKTLSIRYSIFEE